MEVTEHEYDNTTDDSFPFFDCLGCGCWYLNPRPAVSTLDIIYPDNYYARAAAGGPGSRLPDWLTSWLYSRLIASTERHTTLDVNASWFEVGIGQGEQMDRLRRFRGVEQICGVDMSQESIELCKAKNLDAVCSMFEDYEPAAGEVYDVVHSSHVIEHVASPLDYMEKAFQLTKPGGICCFDTPNKDLWEAGVFGSLWGPLHAPRHWVLFGHESAKALGEKVGFEHIETAYSGLWAFWNWTCHHTMERVLGRRIADLFFPSDHRINSSGLLAVFRVGLFNLWDFFLMTFVRKSANMSVVFRRPLDDQSSNPD